MPISSCKLLLPAVGIVQVHLRLLSKKNKNTQPILVYGIYIPYYNISYYAIFIETQKLVKDEPISKTCGKRCDDYSYLTIVKLKTNCS